MGKLQSAIWLTTTTLASNFSTAFAQGIDAGRVLDSVQQRRSITEPQAAPEVLQRDRTQQVAPMLPEGPQQIDVREFRIEGASSLALPRLLKVVEPFAGRNLTPAQMQQAADAVTQAYRESGYPLVRALVLPQPINNGVIVITVREDQLAEVKVPSEATPSVVRSSVESALSLQRAINVGQLEETLILINNMPGRGRASAEIIAPAQSNASSVSIAYALAPKIQGSVTLDSAGNRFTGKGRALAQVVVNEPFNAADQLSLTFLGTDSPLVYAQAAYRVPVTPRLAVGVSASQLNYKLCCQTAGLVSKGDAQSVGLDASYQISLTRASSLAIYTNLDSRRLSSERNGVRETQRRIDALSLGLRGYTVARSVTSWSAALRGGRTDLNGNPLDLAQNATSDVQGAFSKLSATFYQSQSINAAWSWTAQSRAQFNLGRNLDGSERFALGGADGLRAYPSGEAVGDSGWLASGELRYAISALPGLSVAPFIDVGGVRRYSKNTSALLTLMNQARNRYTLAGFGAGIRYDSEKVALTLQIAKPMGGNRGADAAGNNNEGRRDGQVQGWLSASLKF